MEFESIQNIGVPMLLVVGLIGESAYLIISIVQYVHGKHHNKIDGQSSGSAGVYIRR